MPTRDPSWRYLILQGQTDRGVMAVETVIYTCRTHKPSDLLIFIPTFSRRVETITFTYEYAGAS